MEFFIFWVIGWILWMIGYYVYNVYINTCNHYTKRLILYRGFTSGIFSWIGIVFVISFEFAYLIFMLDNWIENKLS